MKKSGFVLLLTCLNPVHAVDLLEIYRFAQESDPQYQQAAAEKSAVIEQRPQALAQLLPALTFSANTFSNDQEILRSAFNPSGSLDDTVSFNSHGYNLDLTQPLFRGDRIIGYLQSGHRVKQAEAELVAAEQDLMIRATAAYFDALAAQDNLSFAGAEKKSLGRQLEQVRQRFEVGLSAITDVQEAQAGYDRAFAAEIEARNNVDNAQETLREITGQYFSGLAGLGEVMPLSSPEPEEIETWTSLALEQNLNVLAARHGVDVARKETKRQIANRLPTLDMVARHALNRSGGRFGAFKSETTSVGVQLNVPLYQGGAINSRVRETRARLTAALERLEQERRRAQRLTRQAYLGVISGISRVRALKQAVASSETALQATEAGFEVGTRTAVDVVAAEQLVSQARRDYARARYDYLLSTLRLKRASGALSSEDLSQVNRWLR